VIAGFLPGRRLLAGGAFLGFLGIALLLLLHRTAPFDYFVSGLFSGLPRPVYLFFSLLCRTGNAEVELPLLLFFGLRLAKRSPELRPRLLLWAGVLVFGTLLEHLLKSHLPAFSPGRAFRHDPLTGWAVFFPIHFHVHASFPSGHTFRALMILLLVRAFSPRLVVPTALWAAGIMVGVVVLGWHFATDVAGSALLVLAFSPLYFSFKARDPISLS